MNRRKFPRRTTTSAACLAAAPSIVPTSARGADGIVAPSNRIVMGCIGAGGQGTGNLVAFLEQPDVRVVAVCDVERERSNDYQGWTRGRAPARPTRSPWRV